MYKVYYYRWSRIRAKHIYKIKAFKNIKRARRFQERVKKKAHWYMTLDSQGSSVNL